MQIDYLANHMEFVPILAQWHHSEWNETTLDLTAAELRMHTLCSHVPTTFVAIDDGQVVGSTSLLIADLKGWEHLTPWVASVFVAPHCRNRGVGRALITRAVDEACQLGVPELFLFTASKQDFYARLGWQKFERAEVKGEEIVIMRRVLRASGQREALSAEERKILSQLDVLVNSPPIRQRLLHVADQVTQKLHQQSADTMAWESLPLEIYSNALPPLVLSSWVFVLRAGATTGAERHPNSHQRVISLRGNGDLQTGGPQHWQSQLLVSDDSADLLRRWATIPPNVWHQAVVPSQDWAVVSFHTCLANDLIEERPDAVIAQLTRQRRYLHA